MMYDTEAQEHMRRQAERIAALEQLLRDAEANEGYLADGYRARCAELEEKLARVSAKARAWRRERDEARAELAAEVVVIGEEYRE